MNTRIIIPDDAADPSRLRRLPDVYDLKPSVQASLTAAADKIEAQGRQIAELERRLTRRTAVVDL